MSNRRKVRPVKQRRSVQRAAERARAERILGAGWEVWREWVGAVDEPDGGLTIDDPGILAATLASETLRRLEVAAVDVPDERAVRQHLVQTFLEWMHGNDAQAEGLVT